MLIVPDNSEAVKPGSKLTVLSLLSLKHNLCRPCVNFILKAFLDLEPSVFVAVAEPNVEYFFALPNGVKSPCNCHVASLLPEILIVDVVAEEGITCCAILYKSPLVSSEYPLAVTLYTFIDV